MHIRKCEARKGGVSPEGVSCLAKKYRARISCAHFIHDNLIVYVYIFSHELETLPAVGGCSVWSSGYTVDGLGKAASAAGTAKASSTTRSPSGRSRLQSWRHTKGDAALRSESKPLSVASRCNCPSGPMNMA